MYKKRFMNALKNSDGKATGECQLLKLIKYDKVTT